MYSCKFLTLRNGNSLQIEIVTRMKGLKRWITIFFKITIFCYGNNDPYTNATWQLSILFYFFKFYFFSLHEDAGGLHVCKFKDKLRSSHT